MRQTNVHPDFQNSSKKISLRFRVIKVQGLKIPGAQVFRLFKSYFACYFQQFSQNLIFYYNFFVLKCETLTRNPFDDIFYDQPVKTCVPEFQLCDGVNDCSNGMDEKNCCFWSEWGEWIERKIYTSNKVKLIYLVLLT